MDGGTDGKRSQQLKDLRRLNASLRRLGVKPICEVKAARGLSDVNLMMVVDMTGDRLVDVMRKLKGC